MFFLFLLLNRKTFISNYLLKYQLLNHIIVTNIETNVHILIICIVVLLQFYVEVEKKKVNTNYM